MTRDYKFKFSIIMSIYNTDKWLREAVDSVITQDIGFEENIQIIFVNDGSPDNSEEICLEYQESYPENIVYIKQDNKGLSGARNTGLRHREGRLVNFFDPDDILTKNTLSEVWKFFTQYGDEINFVAIPLVYFEAAEGMHPKYKTLGDTNRVISIIDEPHNFILSSASSFYKSELLDGIEYDETMHGEEDTLVNFQLYKNNPKFGYVCEKGVTYWYRRRLENNSMVNLGAMKPEGYYSSIYLLEQVQKFYGTIGDAYSELIIYALRSRLSSIRPEFFSSAEEYETILDRMRNFIGQLSHDAIKNSAFLTSNAQKYIFLSSIMQRSPIGMTSQGEVVFDNAEGGCFNPTIFMKNIEMTDDGVVVDMILHDYNIPNLSLELFLKKDDPLHPVKITKIHSRHSVRYGGFAICESTHYRFIIPYNKLGMYKVGITNGRDHFDGINPHKFKYSPFLMNSRKIEKWHGHHRLRVFDNVLEISNSKPRPFLNNLMVTLVVMRRYKKIPFIRLCSRSRKKYILLNDRPIVARDNAEAMFVYINENRPDIAKYTYFVLNNDSPDYRRLKKVGRIVARGSFKHKFLYLNSRIVMSSHLFPGFMCPFSKSEYKQCADLIDRKFIWLQHGITVNDIETAANKFHQGVSGVVVATNGEKKEFRKKKYFYDDEDIIDCGFPRFDRLVDERRNIITVMPTWRQYLSNKIADNGLHEPMEGFDNTGYYKAFSELLKSSALRKTLKQKKLELQFVLHPGVMGNRDAFSKYQNEQIKIIAMTDVDYNKIFRESSLLVTDYSSVFFDFSYLYKPVIFYQFDKEDFFSNHYSKGDYFRYDNDGTGPVLTTHNETIKAILNYIKSDYRLEQKYKKRIDNLFIHHDRDNSKRLIEKLQERGYL